MIRKAGASGKMKYKLSDICTYRNGKVDVKDLNAKTYISTENMLPNKGGITEAASLPTVPLTQGYKKDDVLVSNIRPYFKKIWRAKNDGGCSNDVLVFQANENIDKEFLYYVLANDDFFAYSMATSKGTKMPRGDKFSIMQYEVPNFDLETQRKIAAVLSALDDKIELNTAINENLEQQAQAIFKNLTDDTQSRVPFTSVIQVLGGGTPKTENQDYWNGEIPFFTPKDVSYPYALSTEKTVTQAGLDNCNSRLYPVNTVFLTARGTVGKVSLAGVPMSMNQSCYALVGKNGLNQIIVYHYVLDTVKSLKHKANGAVFDAIITRDFDTEKIPALSAEQATAFLAIAEPIYNSILNRTFENAHLSALHDTLLPKLMNGEIDVSEVKV